ncbi:unnamed protein product, partial [Nesidiocoris tenuis]
MLQSNSNKDVAFCHGHLSKFLPTPTRQFQLRHFRRFKNWDIHLRKWPNPLQSRATLGIA